MKREFNKKAILLGAGALVLISALTIENAMAYFTTYTEAKGAVRMDIGFTETNPQETVDEDGKHITIKNVGSYDCFTRVKVFSVIPIGYSPSQGWSQEDDGYWYYRPVLRGGQSTSQLLVTFEYPKNTEEDKIEEFNIIVVQECTPVVYDEAGNPEPDWSKVITDNGEE